MSDLANIIVRYLDELFLDPKPELNFDNHYQLIVAVVLSAQSTDKQVNKVTKVLFDKYPSIYDLAAANLDDVVSIIKSIGLFYTKAKNIIGLSRIIVDQYQGVIPDERQKLESLPGVGRKTANVVLSNAFGIGAFAVDTHVSRVAKRLAIASQNDSVLVVEKKLNLFFDEMLWHRLHHQIILFGRYYCTAKKPKCDSCGLKDYCLYYSQNHSD